MTGQVPVVFETFEKIENFVKIHARKFWCSSSCNHIMVRNFLITWNFTWTMKWYYIEPQFCFRFNLKRISWSLARKMLSLANVELRFGKMLKKILHKVTTVIICQQRLVRPGHLFQWEYYSLRTPKPETGFESDTSWRVANVLTITQAGGYFPYSGRHIVLIGFWIGPLFAGSWNQFQEEDILKIMNNNSVVYLIILHN